jgi:tetratricopeptide (TPR) repeat protein
LRSLNNLADLYEREGRAADAEPLYLRALAIREHALGPDHPDVATSQNNLAAFYQAQNRTADALPLVEKMLASGRPQLRTALAVLFAAPGKQLMPQDKALDQALAVIQRGNQSSAASAVNKLAVRFAAGSDRLAELVRRDQDLASEADALDKAVVAAVSKPGAHDAASGKRERLAAIAARRAGLQQSLANEFPDYAALSNPLPLNVKDIQALLASDEAMVLFALAEKQSYVAAITRDGFDWKQIPLGADALSQRWPRCARGSMSAAPAMPPANPACSTLRLPTSSMQRCLARSNLS